MRKVIESTLVSLDGLIGDPPVWAGRYFDDEAQANALEHLMASDAMIMGRRTYEAFAEMWPHAPGAYAQRINTMPKYVFSSTLGRADWANTTILRGNVAEEVAKLKQEDGQDLVMYGHGPLGQTLLDNGLLDELRFAVHPVMIDKGTPLRRTGQATSLTLTGTKVLATGVVILTYRPAAT